MKSTLEVNRKRKFHFRPKPKVGQRWARRGLAATYWLQST